MKKFFYYAMMLMLAGFTMTSCETDEEIARRLTGVDWEGDMDTYYCNRWGEEFRDGEYRDYRYRTRSVEADGTETPIYIGEDGKSIATGKFAKALNTKKASL